MRTARHDRETDEAKPGIEQDCEAKLTPTGWRQGKSERNVLLRRTNREKSRQQGGVLEKTNFVQQCPVRVQEYNAPNWFTGKGVFRKRLAIEKKGLPVMKRCIMITLTLAPMIGGPVESYEKGKDRLRRFLREFRMTIGRKFASAWKLEFQENGYAHWHLIIDYKKRIPREGLAMLNQWWGLGRVNVKRLRQKDFRYLFKYVSKGVFADADESGVNLPAWVLDYRRVRKDGRPTSGIRFWQTGGDFYELAKLSTKKKAESRYSKVSYTIRQQVEIWGRKATAFVRDKRGKILASKQLFLKRPWWQFFQNMVWKLVDGKAAYVGETWRCRVNQLNEEIEQWEMNHLKRMEFLA